MESSIVCKMAQVCAVLVVLKFFRTLFFNMAKKGARNTTSNMHFSPFLRGVIYGLFLAGYTYREIADEVEKPDGSHPCKTSVASVVQQATQLGGMGWDGETANGNAGRPRRTTNALDKAIVKLVFKHRGRAKVTVDYIRQMIKAARKVSERTVSRRLAEAGLAWLRRNRKSLITKEHKASRLQWSSWVLARTSITLARWAYTDGTTFFLARALSEFESAKRLALGPQVWRQASGRDGLYEDCVGPSSYAKGQGIPVRVWGLLAGGILFITILPAGECMNREWYTWVIENRFPQWLRKAFGRNHNAFLVQDHERCLWTEEPRAAMQDEGITLLTNYPKCSQDLNPIETAWREVRARLFATAPTHMESRDAFTARLRNAVSWVNGNRKSYLYKICNSQKEWAKDVQNAKPPGSRTKH